MGIGFFISFILQQLCLTTLYEWQVNGQGTCTDEGWGIDDWQFTEPIEQVCYQLPTETCENLLAFDCRRFIARERCFCVDPDIRASVALVIDGTFTEIAMSMNDYWVNFLKLFPSFYYEAVIYDNPEIDIETFMKHVEYQWYYFNNDNIIYDFNFSELMNITTTLWDDSYLWNDTYLNELSDYNNSLNACHAIDVALDWLLNDATYDIKILFYFGTNTPTNTINDSECINVINKANGINEQRIYTYFVRIDYSRVDLTFIESLFPNGAFDQCTFIFPERPLNSWELDTAAAGTAILRGIAGTLSDFVCANGVPTTSPTNFPSNFPTNTPSVPPTGM